MANMLSDTTGRRITGLREREDMTLDELAAKIGINATTLGRIEKGQTQKINSDVLVALAREFSVSTDFLLGLTSIPERKNYDVSELGLSAQSVRNLYTQRVDTDVVPHLYRPSACKGSVPTVLRGPTHLRHSFCARGYWSDPAESQWRR